jgi:hypothetical protein
MGMAHMPKAKANAKTSSDSPTSSVMSLFPEPALNAQPVSPLVAPLTPAVGRPVPPEPALPSLSEEPAETNDTESTEQHVAWSTFTADDEPDEDTCDNSHGSRAPTRGLELPPAAADPDTSHDRLTDSEKGKLTSAGSSGEAGSSDGLAQVTSARHGVRAPKPQLSRHGSLCAISLFDSG